MSLMVTNGSEMIRYINRQHCRPEIPSTLRQGLFGAPPLRLVHRHHQRVDAAHRPQRSTPLRLRDGHRRHRLPLPRQLRAAVCPVVPGDTQWRALLADPRTGAVPDAAQPQVPASQRLRRNADGRHPEAAGRCRRPVDDAQGHLRPAEAAFQRLQGGGRYLPQNRCIPKPSGIPLQELPQDHRYGVLGKSQRIIDRFGYFYDSILIK